MRISYVQCDRCGKRLPLEEKPDTYEFMNIRFSGRVDLCDECSDRFHMMVKSFVESGKEQLIYDSPIEALDLSIRAQNCLKRAGINTVGELIRTPHRELKRIRNIGVRCLEEIETKLHQKCEGLMEELGDCENV